MSRRFIFFGGLSPYEPETIDQLNDANILNDSTVYFVGTPQEKTGAEIWDILNNSIVAIKTGLSLPLGVYSLKNKIGYWYSNVGGNSLAATHNTAYGARYLGTAFGGITYDGSGIQFNGVNGYIDTGANMTNLLANVNMTYDFAAYGFISKTNISGVYVDFGSLDNTGGSDSHIFTYARSGSNFIARFGLAGVNYSQGVANSLGAFAIVRNSITEFDMYKDGVLIATKSSTALPAYGLDVFVLGALNADAVIVQYSPRKYTQFWAARFSKAEALFFESELLILDSNLGR